MPGPGADGSDENPRAYYDRLFVELGSVCVQAMANLAFAQLSLEASPDSDAGRPALGAKPADAASAEVLRILLSSARSVGAVPEGARAARNEARRMLTDGRYILWPPHGQGS